MQNEKRRQLRNAAERFTKSLDQAKAMFLAHGFELPAVVTLRTQAGIVDFRWHPVEHAFYYRAGWEDRKEFIPLESLILDMNLEVMSVVEEGLKELWALSEIQRDAMTKFLAGLADDLDAWTGSITLKPEDISA